MRYISFIILIAVIILSGCSTNNPTTSAQLAENFSTIEELSEATPIILTGKVLGKSEEFQDKGIIFVRTQFKIEDLFRNSLSNGLVEKGEAITILQTMVEEDPILQKNEELLLYLEPYVGPIVKNAYVIKGLMQGHFKVKDGRIFSQAIKKTHIFPEKYKDGIELADFQRIIANNPFNSQRGKGMDLTPEEVKNANEREKQLKVEAMQK